MMCCFDHNIQCPDTSIECEECEHYADDVDDAYDHCYECRGLGDDYIINDDGELECYCDRCGCNPDLKDGDGDG